MLRSLLVLPDGTEISSGAPGPAIVTTRLSRRVNSDTELMPGAVEAAQLTCQLTEAEGVQLAPGDLIRLYYIEDGGEPVLQGSFLVREAQRRGRGILELSACDRLSLLHKDLTAWLMGLTDWPYTLGDFARLVCEACGLELTTQEIPNADTPVRQFSAAGVTGRELMQWVCQAAGRFCRATPEGQAELAWYTTPGDIALAATTGADGGDSTSFYIRMGSLRRADYLTAALDKVQLRADEEDLGTVWPPEATGDNACVFTGNPLLTACDAQELQPVAQSLYTLLAPMRYTPCTLELQATARVFPGQCLTVTDLMGNRFPIYVMATEIAGQGMTLECTGSYTRETSRAVHSYRTLAGRILRLRADVEGLYVENEDAKGALAALEVTAENLRTQVENQVQTTDGITQQMTALEQTAQAVNLKVTAIEQDGVSAVRTNTGYTFNDDGLRISKSGQEIVNLLDNTGMYVMRRDETILQANGDGVVAADVTVRNYLNLGTHARLEDYSNGTDTRRTACFWMEGQDGD